MHDPVIDFKVTWDSVIREVLPTQLSSGYIMPMSSILSGTILREVCEVTIHYFRTATRIHPINATWTVITTCEYILAI